MLNNPGISQLEIVNAINAEAGKKILSKSAISRFLQRREKHTGTKRGMEVPSAEESFSRIATALERTADILEKQVKTAKSLSKASTRKYFPEFDTKNL